jgi:Rieske Fe-S protein
VSSVTTNSPTAQPRTSRRGFLGRVWLGLAGLASLEALWLFLEFLRPRRGDGVAAAEAATVVAGPVERFQPGSVTAFPEGKFYLVRQEDGGFLALHRECTHLGCTAGWSREGRFVCPCHSSSFDMTGRVLSAPARRPLDVLRVRVENGIVKVDTHHRTRRSTSESAPPTKA